MTSAPRRFPTGYGDPVYKLIMALPVLSYERRDALALKWQSVGPAMKVRRVTRWYQRHDRSIIVLLRLLVAVLPLILTRAGVTVEWIISAVVVGLYVTEWLSRKRKALKQAEWIEEAYDAHKSMERDERAANPRA